MPDIVDVIKSQHRQVDSLLEQAQEEGADTAALLRQVSELLQPHSQAEESFVYPTIREHDTREAEQVHDSVAEHHHIEALLTELLSADPEAPGFDGKLAAMVGEIRHHVEEEEQDLLPILAQKASADERAAMGERFLRETGGEAPAATQEMTRDELYDKAKEQDVAGRSSMTKDELAQAVDPE